MRAVLGEGQYVSLHLRVESSVACSLLRSQNQYALSMEVSLRRQVVISGDSKRQRAQNSLEDAT
jgi:hypothetical protein